MRLHLCNIPKFGDFRVTATIPKKTLKRNRKTRRERNRPRLRERRKRILNRIQNRPAPERDQPMITASNIHYELAQRAQGLAAGAIGPMRRLALTNASISHLHH